MNFIEQMFQIGILVDKTQPLFVLILTLFPYQFQQLIQTLQIQQQKPQPSILQALDAGLVVQLQALTAQLTAAAAAANTLNPLEQGVSFNKVGMKGPDLCCVKYGVLCIVTWVLIACQHVSIYTVSCFVLLHKAVYVRVLQRKVKIHSIKCLIIVKHKMI